MSSSVPKYLEISENLKILIRNQTYPPGSMLPADHELGQIYGASRPTVARALKILTKEKLIHRKAGFGTCVLAPNKSMLVAGLLIPQLHKIEIFEPICASLIETATEQGLQIIRPSELSLSQDRRVLAQSLVEQFIQTKVHGVFFAPIEHIDDPVEFNLSILKQLEEAGIKVVLLDRDVYTWPRKTPYDLVGIDNIEAGFTMTNHLIGNGCSKLAFVSAENPAMTVQLRLIGCREAHIQNKMRARDLITLEYPDGKIEGVACRILEEKIDGVVCANDATAAPLLRALLNLGARIPQDVKVCGFDDVKYASLLSIPLTSYHQPCEELGKVAAETMIARIMGSNRPAIRVALDGQLIARESSAAES
ncbi:GntR family transcriptional regulator [Verrucomicrobiaceae bacterium 227]